MILPRLRHQLRTRNSKFNIRLSEYPSNSSHRSADVVEVDNDYSTVHARLAQKWKATFSHQSLLSSSLGMQKSVRADAVPMMAPQVCQILVLRFMRLVIDLVRRSEQTPLAMPSKGKAAVQSASSGVRRARTKPRMSDPFPMQCGLVAQAPHRPNAAASRVAAGTRAAPISIDDDLDEIEDEEVMITTSARGKLQSFR